jgi:hypothetical protein
MAVANGLIATGGSVGATGDSMSSNLCCVSGIDPDPEARDVFVWHHDRAAGKFVLLGTGRIVGSGGSFTPPGVPRGQYRVTFNLRPEVSTDDIHVTDDRSGNQFLSGVTVARGLSLDGIMPVGRAGR